MSAVPAAAPAPAPQSQPTPASFLTFAVTVFREFYVLAMLALFLLAGVAAVLLAKDETTRILLTACCGAVLFFAVTVHKQQQQPPPPPQQQQSPAAAPTCWQRMKATMAASGLLELTRLVPLLATVLTLASVFYVLRYETEEAITNDMVDTFATGVDGWVPSDENATVARAALMGDLLPILHPDHSKQYFVILGEKGVGKSTAVRQTIRAMREPRGVIYVMVPSASANAFLTRLTTATRYREPVGFFELIRRRATGSTGNVAVSSGLWDVLEKKLLEVGKAYLAKYKRPPVLVIDAADKIYKKDPELLFDIQALAKDGADSGCLRMVFVISETSAFEMLQSHSHASRSKTFVVGEIEDNEAVEYLVSKGVNKENATDAVARITGGRFALLNSYMSDHQRGLTNDQVLAKHIAATNRALKRLHIKKTDPLFSNVAAGSLYEKDDLIDVDELSKLARENILVVDLATGLVTFNSRHVQTFFTETGAGDVDDNEAVEVPVPGGVDETTGGGDA